MSETFSFEQSCSGDCGSCGSDCGTSSDQPTVTLTLDDDREVTCAVINIFPVDKNQYIALLPLNDKGEPENGDVYLYRFSTDEANNPVLGNIETEEEYQAAADAFNKAMDQVNVTED